MDVCSHTEDGWVGKSAAKAPQKIGKNAKSDDEKGDVGVSAPKLSKKERRLLAKVLTSPF